MDSRAEAFAACPDTGCDWGSFYLGWKASREALVVELPDPWDHLNPQSYGEDIKDALYKAGIKWK